MLDLHCHILPEVDDGAASLDEALAMARFCVQDGITHVVATPHCHRYTRLLRADILPRVERLNDELRRAALQLTVLPGSEIQVTDVALYRREFAEGLYCHLGDSRLFTLLEFPWQVESYPSHPTEFLTWLRGSGMTPIIAHPERYGYFQKEPERVAALAEAGAWLQLTVDSLLGKHGPSAQSAGKAILGLYPNVVLASDAHNLQRCSGLSAGYSWVRDRYGPERSEDLRSRSGHILAAIG